MLKAILTWLRQTTIEDGYRIYRSEEPLDLNNLPEPLVTLPPGASSYVDDTVENNKTYYYAVSVFKGNLERVSATKLFTPTYMDSGPGPQELIGHNDTAGFFGEVPVEDLISGSDLASMIGLSAGSSTNSNQPWLKFFLDDKILFVAKKPYRRSLTWDSINEVDAVYGNRTLTIQGYQFRIRLLKGADNDPAEFIIGDDPVGTHNSEWNRLIYNVHQDIPDSQVGDNWANYTDSDLNIESGNGRHTWCQETWSDDSSYRVYRGNDGSLRRAGRTRSSYNIGSYYAWRPVLELVTQ